MDPEKPGGAETSPESTENSSIDLAGLKAEFEKLIDEKITKATQSSKDKRFAKLEGESRETKTQIDELRTRLARLDELTSAGLTRDQALYQMEGEELLANLRTQATRQGAPSQSAGENELETFMQEIGLDPNAPEVLEILRAESNPLRQASKLTQLAAKRQSENQSNLNPAKMISGGGGKSNAPNPIKDIKDPATLFKMGLKKD